ncbi:methyl-accepting chemotaxis protein [Clostridiisalibacter paucivorans]|uniref:methyl-accepting chemotaxis protein n=1 Tax=Clostridiisalibacter paucivorans TaxID=408753 RepID=UPI00047CF017|nr:methyl-accepting chemotaxis protein [Clostridiisalibacter paucivorans]
MKEAKLTQFKSSIKYRLIIWITSSILLLLGILGYLSYNETHKAMKNKLSLTSQQTLEAINEEVSMFLTVTESKVESLSEANITLKGVDEFNNKLLENGNTDMLINLMGGFAHERPEILDLYVGTKLGEIISGAGLGVSEDYDPRVRDWYKDALNSQDAIWSDPYVDESTNQVTVTVSKVLRNSNEDILGVIAADIVLDEFGASIGNTKIGKKGQVYVTSEQGVMIANVDTEIIGKRDYFGEQLWSSIESEKEDENQYNIGKEKKYLYHITNEKTGWKIFAELDESELLSDTNGIKRYIIFWSIIGVAIGIVLAFIIARNIHKPLLGLKSAFQQAAKGDLNSYVDIKTKDEFGETGYNFNIMIDNLKNMISHIIDASNTINESSDGLNTITEQTSTAAGEVASTIEDLAKGGEQQARDTENGAMRMSNLADILNKLNNAVKYMGDISDDTNKISDDGSHVINELEYKSKDNEKSIEKINSVVNKLSDSSKDIDKITVAIGDIAEQTNLLALNAAIEAARAGEAGRGFAVVAEEIRNLAEETTNSVGEINKIIMNMQQGTEEAVNAMEDVKSSTEEQKEAVSNTGIIFENINESLNNLITRIKDCQSMIDDMDVEKGEVLTIMESISAAAEETSASTQEVSASTEQQLAAMEEVSSYVENMHELAQYLKEEVNKFKI